MLWRKIFTRMKKEHTDEKVKTSEVEINTKEEIKTGPIITIAREFGSGGREIALKVSQKLNLDFYDKEKIIETAKKKGIDTELFQQLDETKVDGFWLYVSPKEYDFENTSNSIEEKMNNDKMFMIQSDTIRDIAKKGNLETKVRHSGI